MLHFEKQYRVNQEFERIQRSEKWIYVNYYTAEWIRTNQYGKEILDACNGNTSLGEVIDNYAASIGFPPVTIRENCSDFLERAVNIGLLYAGEMPPKPQSQIQHMRSPETIWIHVSSQCNLRCPYCYSESSPNGLQNLDAEKILFFLSQTDPEMRKYVIISGGEPFLYEPLEILLSGIKNLGFQVQLITNGTIGHSRYGAVREYVDRIQFSIDGTTADVHDLTRGKGAFEKTLTGLQTARAVGFPFIMVSFLASANNMHQIPQLPRFASEHQIQQINLSRIIPAGRGRNVDFYVDEYKYGEQLKLLVKEYEKISGGQKEILISLADDNSEKLRLPGRRRSCGLADSIISIWYDGNVYPCASLQDSQFIIGRYTDSFEALIEKGHQLNNLYCTDHPDSGCANCKYRYFCGGGCLAKRMADRDGSYCERCKKEIDYLFETIE